MCIRNCHSHGLVLLSCPCKLLCTFYCRLILSDLHLSRSAGGFCALQILNRCSRNDGKILIEVYTSALGVMQGKDVAVMIHGDGQ